MANSSFIYHRYETREEELKLSKMVIRGRISLGVKVLIVVLAPAIIYWQDLFLVASEALKSDLSSHILVVPFLFTYIVYRIRRMLLLSVSSLFASTTSSRTLPVEEVAGALLCLLAYLIRWFGSFTFQPLDFHVASLPLFVAGIVLIVFNTQTLRILLFPIVFLAFLLPPPLEIAQSAGAALATLSSRASYAILKTVGLPVSLLEAFGTPVIFLSTSSGEEIPFAVDIACSGLYSLIGFVLFAVFTAYLARGPLPKKAAILSMGLPLIYGFNILRITLIVVIGFYLGADAALSGFHLLGGWVLILLGTLLLLVIAEKILNIRIFGTTSDACTHSVVDDEEGFCVVCGKILEIPAVGFSRSEALKLVLVLAFVVSSLFIQVPVFALTEGRAEAILKSPAGDEKTLKVFPRIEGYELGFVYEDVAFENISGQDASLIYQYVPENRSKPIVWVGLEIGSTMGCLHRWEVCLIRWPQTHGRRVLYTQLDLRDIHLLDNPPLSARYFAFQRKSTNDTQIILYWYTRSIFETEEGYEQKWSKISVIQYIRNPREYEAAEDELLPFAEAIAGYWQPVITWSWAALAIAENGSILLAITATLLAVAGAFSFYLRRNKINAAKKTYTLISDKEELSILKAVKTLKEPRNIPKIAAKYEELSGEEIDLEKLRKKLFEAVETGLIEMKITSQNDKPYINWKTNF